MGVSCLRMVAAGGCGCWPDVGGGVSGAAWQLLGGGLYDVFS